ncbi:DUF4163 domain-containing protein [Tepidibacter aestuarii]|uniref:DUF4163 domain-containing protein n=1 Tax=Tepidibacter aestuarii TaxID=2925782 RepID=UPI0020BF3A5C|nr:DUF4163 domain-containing protein [Tepidibacter aestuarii]CAH2212656.1 exported protein of unknown function [Tepidibacter aestuarii]
MKNLKLLSVLLIVFILASISIGCTKKDAVKSTNEETVINNNSYTTESVTNTFDTKIYEEDLSLELTYPQIKGLENKELENKINETIKGEFLGIQSSLWAEANVVDESFEITSKTPDILSIKYNYITSPDNISKYEFFETININMKNGKLIRIQNLFNSEESVEKVKSIVDNIIKNQNFNIKNPIGNTNIYENIYFTDKNMIIYYENDELVEIEVPLNKILEYINI